MKRSVKKILILSICSLTLTGCSTQEQITETEEEKHIVELPVMFRVDPVTNQSDNEQFVQDFNRVFSNTYHMDVEWLTESTSGYRNKLKQWNVLDELPLLITDAAFDYDFYRILVENDRLVDLRPYMEDSDFWINAMNQEVLDDITEENGGIYLSPLGSNVHTYAGIIYNEELLRQAGYEEVPDTWEGFFTCLSDLKEAGINPLALHGAGSYWVPMLFGTAYLSQTETGRNFLNQDFPESYQNGSMEEMLETLKQMYQYTYEDALEIEYEEAAQRFLDGEAAIIANGKWMFDTMTEEQRCRLKFTAFPGNVLMNEPRMSAWAVTTGYSEEIIAGAVKALEYRIRCEQKDVQEVLNPESDEMLITSYAEVIQSVENVMPNYQMKWEQEIQNEFFTAYLPEYLAGRLETEDFLWLMDERVKLINSGK